MKTEKNKFTPLLFSVILYLVLLTPVLAQNPPVSATITTSGESGKSASNESIVTDSLNTKTRIDSMDSALLVPLKKERETAMDTLLDSTVTNSLNTNDSSMAKDLDSLLTNRAKQDSILAPKVSAPKSNSDEVLEESGTVTEQKPQQSKSVSVIQKKEPVKANAGAPRDASDEVEWSSVALLSGSLALFVVLLLL